MVRRFAAASAWMWPALATCLLLMWYRVRLVDEAYGHYTGCLGCFDASVWANDGYLAAAFVALYALSRLTSNRIARAILAGAVAGSAIAYGVDVVVFRLLAHRLITVDVLHYGGEGGDLVSVVQPLLAHVRGWLLLGDILALSSLGALAILSGTASRKVAAAWGAVCAIVIVASYQVHRPTYVYPEALRNLVQVNLDSLPSPAYSKDTWLALQRRPPPAPSCATGLDRSVPVILLVVESLSAYHSKLLSGISDDTPNLDRIARANTYFPQFTANGYNTEGGLIALLTGHVPLPVTGFKGSVMSFSNVEGDFHRRLQREGYYTAFFTSGDLSFGDREDWLEAIGIQHAEGSTHPFYTDMPRGPFRSAPDAALFDRFLQWYDHERPQRPFMATILTVRTHPPYGAPGDDNDEKARFRAVDTDIAHFVDALEQHGFFRDGLLFITGDHRAMTPLERPEEMAMRPGAAWRVPFIIVGRSVSGRGPQPGRFQQVDLIPSLTALLDDQACRTAWQGQFLGANPRPARFAIAADGERRNEVRVLEGSSEYRILLDGDGTRWVVPPRDATARREVLDRVNRERISRMVEFSQVSADARE